MALAYKAPADAWLDPLKRHLLHSISQEPPKPPATQGHNLASFVCSGGARILWDGLHVLSTLSDAFAGANAQDSVVIVPGRDAAVVRDLLVVLSSGVAKVGAREALEMNRLAKDLGVSI